MRITRRHLVASAALVSGAAFVGTTAVGLGYRAWWHQPRAQHLRYLSDDEAAFADALADAIFPPCELFPIRGGDASVASFMDEVFSGMPSAQRDLVRLSLHALDQHPRLTHGSAFRDLDLPDAVEVLAGWTASGVPELRGIVASVYIFVTMAYSVHPQIAPVFATSFRCGYGR